MSCSWHWLMLGWWGWGSGSAPIDSTEGPRLWSSDFPERNGHAVVMVPELGGQASKWQETRLQSSGDRFKVTPVSQISLAGQVVMPEFHQKRTYYPGEKREREGEREKKAGYLWKMPIAFGQSFKLSFSVLMMNHEDIHILRLSWGLNEELAHSHYSIHVANLSMILCIPEI